MQSTKRLFIVEGREIAYLRFIFEAYDGLALLRTVDAGKGLVELYISPGCEPDADSVIEDLKKEILIIPVKR